MFILFQKYRNVYRNKVNSRPIRQFPSFLIFGHVTCHMTIIKLLGTRKPQDLLLGKNSFCSIPPSERYRQSFLCSEHTFDPGLKPLENENFKMEAGTDKFYDTFSNYSPIILLLRSDRRERAAI